MNKTTYFYPKFYRISDNVSRAANNAFAGREFETSGICRATRTHFLVRSVVRASRTRKSNTSDHTDVKTFVNVLNVFLTFLYKKNPSLNSAKNAEKHF